MRSLGCILTAYPHHFRLFFYYNANVLRFSALSYCVHNQPIRLPTKSSRVKMRKLFLLNSVKPLVRSARFNFYQFFFFKKTDTKSSEFFKVFSAELPENICFFFYKYYSVVFKLGNLLTNHYSSQAKFLLSDPTVPFYYLPINSRLLLFLEHKFRSSDYSRLSFILKKHFFLKSHTKKLFFSNNFFAKNIVNSQPSGSFILDSRWLFIYFRPSRKHVNMNTLNWFQFNTYFWKYLS